MANVPPRPVGKNFYGLFHTPLPAGSYQNMYNDTYWDFDATWKAQIDAMAAIGANVMVYFGDVSNPNGGSAALATYLGRRRQIVEYLATKRMFALPYATSTPSGWGGPSLSQAQTILEADAAMMSKYPNVIGYVCIDEIWQSYGAPLSLGDAGCLNYVSTLYNAVKAVVPADFGVCGTANAGGDFAPGVNSYKVFNFSGQEATRYTALAPYCDFFCCHPFQIAPTYAHSADLRAAYPGKAIMMPSSILATNSNGSMATYANATIGLVGANDYRGMGWFLTVDFDSNTWGVFNSDLTPRTAKTTVFTAAVPASAALRRSIRPYRGKPRLNALRNFGYK